MIFDMDPSVSGYNLNDKALHDALFGHITNENELHLEEMTNKLIDDINSVNEKTPASGGTRNTTRKIDLAESKKKELSNMSKSERQELFFEILDKGANKLSVLDKEILDYISKKA